MPTHSKHSGLQTDLYELTMAAAYLETGFDAKLTFELFVRHMPPRRNYLVAAGLDQALDYLENVNFSHDDIQYLRNLPVFRSIRDNFFEYLSRFRFSGDVWAMPEGTVFFPGEPILRVTGPAIEAQIAETYLLAAINFQTMIASKAARVVQAAGGRPVIEFGSRRAHGMEAGVLAARAAVIGGCQGTSNVCGREAIRNSCLRHAGAFLDHGARRGRGSLRQVSRRLSGAVRVARGYLRCTGRDR